MSAYACLTCTKTIGPDLSVIICDHGHARAALSKHFWFDDEKTAKGILCQSCCGKIADFHQFYCEIERLHEIPNQLAQAKQELTIAVEENDGDALHCDENDDDDDGFVNETEREQKDQESAPRENNACEAEMDVKKAKVTKNKTAKQKGRPESFITENVNLLCDTCSKKCDSFRDLQKHSLMEHEKQAYVFCCDRKFNHRERLIDHIESHLNPDRFKCELCSKQFGDSRGLNLHKVKAHTAEEEKTLQCSVCVKKFSQKKYLHIHEKFHRKLEEKQWHCASCDKYFAYQTMLRTHNRTVHSTDYQHVCHVCAKGFHYLSTYRDHLQSHEENPKKERTPDERIQCPDCGVWIFKKCLGSHKLQHTGSKRCEICGQECKNEMTLKYHLAQHRKDALVCTVCGKSFKKELLLKEHMASHTGEVLYRCDFCDKTFRSHANKAAHRKKMHPKEWLEDKLQKNPHKQHEPDRQLQQYMQANFQDVV